LILEQKPNKQHNHIQFTQNQHNFH
jgi:hypothetical protein